ncbi:hypothetical protein HZS_472 [Henneguya salminicola]|nr:hypothetical protein HZS_472 [Henneguya salminicola]
MATELDKPEYTSLLPYELILQPIFSKCDDISPGFSKDFIELFMHEDDFNLPISTVILNGWCKLKRTIKLSDAEAVKLNKDLES